ncbi:MAG: TPM domain-containing protein [Flavobacteriaceae bacterium]
MKRKALFYFLILVSAFSFGQRRYPDLKAIATDSGEIFTALELEELKMKLIDFETETTNQLVVLTINDLGYETIEEYANGTFNQNKLGQKNKDNGILILFAKNNREVRIEVGYGLEQYITDAVASRIIRKTMIPEFKEENYVIGLNRATDQIIDFLKSPEALEEFKKEIEEEGEMGFGVKLFFILFLCIFVAAGGFIFYKSYRNIIEVFRGMMIGKLSVVQGLFMAVFGLIPVLFSLVFVLMPLFFMVMIFDFEIVEGYDYLLENNTWVFVVIGSFLGFTMLLAILKILIKGKEGFKLSLLKSDKTYMSKTFSSSGSHSFGSSSSSGGSSSSFSGGGGSSGGGGASGSW